MDVTEILAGTADPKHLNERDRKGPAPVTFSAMEAARVAGELLPLLQLLEPKDRREPPKIDQLLTLVEEVAAARIRIEQRMLAIEPRLAALSSDSSKASPLARSDPRR